MRVSQIGLVVAFVLGISCSQSRVTAATEAEAQSAKLRTPEDWRKATRDDVLAAYQIFSRHHPGMFDPNNRGFRAKLRQARDAAFRFGRKANDAEGHMRALALFSAVLADGHARVQASYSGHGDMLWPGFRTAWRGRALYVVDRVDGAPPPSSTLLGCDGKDARTVIRASAFSFYGRPAEAGQWWKTRPPCSCAWSCHTTPYLGSAAFARPTAA